MLKKLLSELIESVETEHSSITAAEFSDAWEGFLDAIGFISEGLPGMDLSPAAKESLQNELMANLNKIKQIYSSKNTLVAKKAVLISNQIKQKLLPLLASVQQEISPELYNLTDMVIYRSFESTVLSTDIEKFFVTLHAPSGYLSADDSTLRPLAEDIVSRVLQAREFLISSGVEITKHLLPKEKLLPAVLYDLVRFKHIVAAAYLAAADLMDKDLTKFSAIGYRSSFYYAFIKHLANNMSSSDREVIFARKDALTDMWSSQLSKISVVESVISGVVNHVYLTETGVQGEGIAEKFAEDILNNVQALPKVLGKLYVTATEESVDTGTDSIYVSINDLDFKVMRKLFDPLYSHSYRAFISSDDTQYTDEAEVSPGVDRADEQDDANTVVDAKASSDVSLDSELEELCKSTVAMVLVNNVNFYHLITKYIHQINNLKEFTVTTLVNNVPFSGSVYEFISHLVTFSNRDDDNNTVETSIPMREESFKILSPYSAEFLSILLDNKSSEDAFITGFKKALVQFKIPSNILDPSKIELIQTKAVASKNTVAAAIANSTSVTPAQYYFSKLFINTGSSLSKVVDPSMIEPLKQLAQTNELEFFKQFTLLCLNHNIPSSAFWRTLSNGYKTYPFPAFVHLLEPTKRKLLDSLLPVLQKLSLPSRYEDIVDSFISMPGKEAVNTIVQNAMDKIESNRKAFYTTRNVDAVTKFGAAFMQSLTEDVEPTEVDPQEYAITKLYPVFISAFNDLDVFIGYSIFKLASAKSSVSKALKTSYFHSDKLTFGDTPLITRYFDNIFNNTEDKEYILSCRKQLFDAARFGNRKTIKTILTDMSYALNEPLEITPEKPVKKSWFNAAAKDEVPDFDI